MPARLTMLWRLSRQDSVPVDERETGFGDGLSRFTFAAVTRGPGHMFFPNIVQLNFREKFRYDDYVDHSTNTASICRKAGP